MVKFLPNVRKISICMLLDLYKHGDRQLLLSDIFKGIQPAEQNPLGKFGRGHYEEHKCDILNLDQRSSEVDVI